MGLQVKNLARLDTEQRAAIRRQAEEFRSSLLAPKSSS
jgi:hypothetical protein